MILKTENGHIPKNEGRKHKRRYRPSDPDFVAPDGGWGWLVIVACGFSNLCNFPMFQQFGLVFREKLETLGMNNTQMTTIVNLNSAFNCCVGLLNGPVYRKFTYRQVAAFGSLLVASSLFISRYCHSFYPYLIFFAACYGSGIGTTQSANSIALNTFWKKKRRIATGLSWSVTGVGPIVLPYIVTYLMDKYGMENTLMLFAGFALHSFACSLLLQPVHWHTKYREDEKNGKVPNGDVENQEHKVPLVQKPRSVFSSQILFRDQSNRFSNSMEHHETGTPMLAGPNDGWYSQKNSLAGSRISLASSKGLKVSGQNSLVVSSRTSYANLQDLKDKEAKREKKKSTIKSAIPIQEIAGEDCPTQKAVHDLKEEEKSLLAKQNGGEKEVLYSAAKKLEELQNKDAENGTVHHQIEVPKITVQSDDVVEEKPQKLSFCQKVVLFFDFSLLKDPMYLNLMLGLTIANFAEINFSILTPFVLKEFNFEDYQIATFMSVLGALDILVRLFVPFVAEKLDWDNKTFFLIGVLMMAGGRIVLVHTQTYAVSIFVAVIIGFGKGLRTIFLVLVIPGYVPLERLPAASGLQLCASGLSFLIFGPVIGWIRDVTQNYVITLHLLNITTYITTIAWLVEPHVTRYYKNKKLEEQNR